MRNLLLLTLLLCVGSPAFAQLRSVPFLGAQASDPAGACVNGTQYYNTTITKQKCCENGAWKLCGVEYTGADGQVTFGSATGITSEAAFTYNDVSDTLTCTNANATLVTAGDYRATSAASAPITPTTGVTPNMTSERYVVSALASDGLPILFDSDGVSIFARKCIDNVCSGFSSTTSIISNIDFATVANAVTLQSGKVAFLVKNTSGQGILVRCENDSCTTVATAVIFAATEAWSMHSLWLFPDGKLALSAAGTSNMYYRRCDDPTATTPCGTMSLVVAVGSNFGGVGYVVVTGGGLPVLYHAQTVHACSDTSCSTDTEYALGGMTQSTQPFVGTDGFLAWGRANGSNFEITRCTDNPCSTRGVFNIPWPGNLPNPGATPTFGLGQLSDGRLVPAAPYTSGANFLPYALICGDSTCSGSNTGIAIGTRAINSYYKHFALISDTNNVILTAGMENSTGSYKVQVAYVGVGAPNYVGTNVCEPGTECANGSFAGTVTAGKVVISDTGNSGDLTVQGSARVGDGDASDTLIVQVGAAKSNAIVMGTTDDNYLRVNTAGEVIELGNAVTNPAITQLGSGAVSLNGQTTITRTPAAEASATTAMCTSANELIKFNNTASQWVGNFCVQNQALPDSWIAIGGGTSGYSPHVFFSPNATSANRHFMRANNNTFEIYNGSLNSVLFVRPSDTNVTAITVGGFATVNGNATLGDTSSDTHTVNGSMTINNGTALPINLPANGNIDVINATQGGFTHKLGHYASGGGGFGVWGHSGAANVPASFYIGYVSGTATTAFQVLGRSGTTGSTAMTSGDLFAACNGTSSDCEFTVEAAGGIQVRETVTALATTDCDADSETGRLRKYSRSAGAEIDLYQCSKRGSSAKWRAVSPPQSVIVGYVGGNATAKELAGYQVPDGYSLEVEKLTFRLSGSGAGGTTNISFVVAGGASTCTATLACNATSGVKSLTPTGTCSFPAGTTVTFEITSGGDCTTPALIDGTVTVIGALQ